MAGHGCPAETVPQPARMDAGAAGGRGPASRARSERRAGPRNLPRLRDRGEGRPFIRSRPLGLAAGDVSGKDAASPFFEHDARPGNTALQSTMAKPHGSGARCGVELGRGGYGAGTVLPARGAHVRGEER